MLEGFLSQFETYVQGSSLTAFLAAYLGGVLVGFTPCVYPVIPILVAYVGGKAGDSRSAGFVMSGTYVLGMAIVYTLLGGFAALSGKVFGQVQANPWVYFIAANICILFGLSMLDVFHLPLPLHATLDKIRPARASGLAGCLLLGATSGFLIGPCTTPILAVLLMLVAGGGNVPLGMGLLFVFALGMGTLLLALGTFAGLAATLPRSGNWLNLVQKTGGLVLIGIGEYFLIVAGQMWV